MTDDSELHPVPLDEEPHSSGTDALPVGSEAANRRDVASDSDEAASIVDSVTEEFTARIRDGEYPSVTEYIERYPDQADELREVLPAVAMMEQLKRKDDSQASSLEKRASMTGLKRLGDFCIVREIGHGGMGVVYEANQESLGRRVALKVLSPAALSSRKSVERFHREAETVGKLHHTNIVPVFGVGEEQGLHYYVMQLINGQPLSQVINTLRERSGSSPALTLDRSAGQLGVDPTDSLAGPLSMLADVSHGQVFAPDAPSGAGAVPSSEAGLQAVGRATHDSADSNPQPSDTRPTAARPDADISAATRLTQLLDTRDFWQTVAGIGIQVARALAYAHRQGVWHRDIKPSNLLIDENGIVWIVDFGLARMAEDSDLTQTGDMIGTLRYMSPEQLVGKFDERSDQYGLGLTLYELLTFHPAHDASIRARIVEQVKAAQPKPPRSFNRQIPLDLETIVLKAMAHDPEHRYPSARELAADLQRFIDGVPIRARRIGPAEMIWRWTRRNPALALSTFTTIALLVMVAAVSTWGYLTVHAANEGLITERSRTASEQQRTAAQHERAEANLMLAMEAFDGIIDHIASRGLPESIRFDLGEDTAEFATPTSAPALTEADARLLKHLLSFYVDFAEKNETSGHISLAVASAQRRIGDIYQRLGQSDDALKAYEDAAMRYRAYSNAVASGVPVDQRSVTNALLPGDELPAANGKLALAEVLNQIGNVQASNWHRSAARSSHEEAVELLRSLPDHIQQLPETRFLLARSLNWRVATSQFPTGADRGIAGQPARPDRDTPSDAQQVTGTSREAGTAAGSAQGPLADIDGNDEQARRDRWAEAWEARRRAFVAYIEDLKSDQREASGLLRGLVDEFPDHAEYQLELARVCQTVVKMRSLRENSDSARDELNTAIDLLEDLVERFPYNPEYRFELADTLAMSSRDIERSESGAETFARVDRAAAIVRTLYQQNPNVPEYGVLLADCQRRLSDMDREAGNLERATQRADSALTVLREISSRWPGHALHGLTLARTLQHSAMLQQRQDHFDVGLERINEAIALLERTSQDGASRQLINGRLWMLFRHQGDLLRRAGRDEEAALADEKASAVSERLRADRNSGNRLRETMPSGEVPGSVSG